MTELSNCSLNSIEICTAGPDVFARFVVRKMPRSKSSSRKDIIFGVGPWQSTAANKAGSTHHEANLDNVQFMTFPDPVKSPDLKRTDRASVKRTHAALRAGAATPWMPCAGITAPPVAKGDDGNPTEKHAGNRVTASPTYMER